MHILIFKLLDCTAYNVIAFHAYLKSTLHNITPNTTITFESVHLNKGDGYDPASGIFTAPEDGVYSFAWSFLSKKGVRYILLLSLTMPIACILVLTINKVPTSVRQVTSSTS